MFSLLCNLVSSAVGTLIPLFYSFKTIKKPTHKASAYWLKYWCVYGMAYTLDAVLDTFFLTWFIPFYEFSKLLFVLWCVNPYTSGAQFTFDKILAPFIRKHERRMEKMIDKAVAQMSDHGSELLALTTHRIWSCLNFTEQNAADFDETMDSASGPSSSRVVQSSQNSTTDLSYQPAQLVLREVKQEPADDSFDQIEIIGHSRHSNIEIQASDPESEVDFDSSLNDQPTAPVRARPAIPTIDANRIVKDEHEEVVVRRSTRLRSRAQGVAAIRRWSRSRSRVIQQDTSDASV